MKLIATLTLAAAGAFIVTPTFAYADDPLRAVIRDAGKSQQVTTPTRVAPTIALSIGEAPREQARQSRIVFELRADPHGGVRPTYVRK